MFERLLEGSHPEENKVEIKKSEFSPYCPSLFVLLNALTFIQIIVNRMQK